MEEEKRTREALERGQERFTGNDDVILAAQIRFDELHMLQAGVGKIKNELVPKVQTAQLNANTTRKAFDNAKKLSSQTRNATAALIRPVCQA